MMRQARGLLACLVLFSVGLIGPGVCYGQGTSRTPLPTPRSHYDRFTPGLSGQALLTELMTELDPEARQAVVRELASPEAGVLIAMVRASSTAASKPPKAEALALLQRTDWTVWRPFVLEFMLHQSAVLDILPPQYRTFWTPILHDSLLYFLDHLPPDRLSEKLLDIAYLPAGSTRSDYLSAFVAKTPSLQKVGQIVARIQALSPEYRAALQQLENGIHTISRDELVAFINGDVGSANMAKYQVELADSVLAEASVGAVIRATAVPPDSRQRVDAICKVVKPYVLANLPQELDIIDGLASYFTREHDYYRLGAIPVGDMFKGIKEALANEIKIVEEQHNLQRAWQYYRKDKNIVVPKLYPISTQHVTFMEYIAGEKITDAFAGQPLERAIMAKRFFDVMTRDVIFSSASESIFHGDPHAGNVFHATADADNPYRIALLDWGLYGTFPRNDRIAMVQLILGVQLKDAERLHRNVGALIEGGLPDAPAKLKRIDAIIADVIDPKHKLTGFSALEALLGGLVNEGYATKYTLNLFIKSQVTIAGILHELDPTLDQDKYMMQRVIGLAKREIPKRLLFTVVFPLWDSHSYRSLLSNKDVWDARKMSRTPKTAKK